MNTKSNTKNPSFVMPEHYNKVYGLIKTNCDVRRFTSLGIINYLMQKGEISKDSNSKFVVFKPNKFTVKVDGLGRDYLYKEDFFLNCFSSAFITLSAYAQKAIEDFINIELRTNIDNVIDRDEIINISTTVSSLTENKNKVSETEDKVTANEVEHE